MIEGYGILDQTFVLTGTVDITGNVVVKPDAAPSFADAFECEIADVAGGPLIGVAQVDRYAKFEPGDHVPVRMLGISRAVAGEAIDPGDAVTTDANGYVIKATAAHTWVLGTALTKATQVYDDVIVFVNPTRKE